MTKKGKTIITKITAEEAEALRGKEITPDPETPQADSEPAPTQEPGAPAIDESALNIFIKRINERFRIILGRQDLLERGKNPFRAIWDNQHSLSWDQALKAVDEILVGGFAVNPAEPGAPLLSADPGIMKHIEVCMANIQRKIDTRQSARKEAEEQERSKKEK